MIQCFPLRLISSWLNNYDDVSSAVVVLLYLQVFFGLIGSLGVSYTGIISANLILALFALVAIASGYQSLGRAYAFFLIIMIIMDVVWLTFFGYEIWNFSDEDLENKWALFSIHLVLYSELCGFILRLISSFLWLQMFRMGLSSDPSSNLLSYHALENDGSWRPDNISPSSPSMAARLPPDEFLGASIFFPSAYNSLFRLSSIDEKSKDVETGSAENLDIENPSHEIKLDDYFSSEP